MSGLLKRFRDGDRQALARILTHVENQTELGWDAIRALSSDSGRAHVLGLTGPPGAGKSTLANAMIREIRKFGRSVAVVAIDPSSPFTGGATLGDRIRMLDSQADDRVYLRSMASRGHIGGLTLAAFGSALVLDAFGFDFIIIETVGTGQDEVEIARLADSVIVVQTPGMGDSIQAVKAGILEIADLLVVNKADAPGASEVVRDLRQEARMRPDTGWTVPVIPVIAVDGNGVDRLVSELANHRAYLQQTSLYASRRSGRLTHHARMLAIRQLSDFLANDFESNDLPDDPVKIATEMIRGFIESQKKGASSR